MIATHAAPTTKRPTVRTRQTPRQQQPTKRPSRTTRQRQPTPEPLHIQPHIPTAAEQVAAREALRPAPDAEIGRQLGAACAALVDAAAQDAALVEAALDRWLQRETTAHLAEQLVGKLTRRVELLRAEVRELGAMREQERMMYSDRQASQ